MHTTRPENKWGIPFRTGNDIRRSFISFFTDRGHTFVPSSPVVPHDDPTLLFINSGMNQFKALFLGDNRQGLKRAANSQKCLRVSGKHNDLDEVGRDTYHHTFFEMLGNWSFGDYYKRDAIKWSWELLTSVWGLPKDRLFATVYKDDDEAEQIWRTETDIDPRRIMRFGEKSNFWEMGEIGPCGPCTEIHFDMGDPETREATFADPVEGVNGQNSRYIEIWNNVFMQFERLGSGELKPLTSKHVDTGMGFERICSIIQGSGSNYETDVFQPIIARIAALSGVPYEKGDKGIPHRVIADHVRALAFAIADGATPGNEGRGYVLRRILRRASRFSQKLNLKEPFIHRLIPVVAEVMREAYPEVAQRADYVAQVIEAEESRFMRTLKDGLIRFERLATDARQAGKTSIAGADAFLLYDTYGFPLDLTGILAQEQGLTVDQAGFDKSMTEQRERARSSAKFDASMASDEGWTILDSRLGTDFVGYDSLVATTGITRFREVGDDILVCLRESPFYAESGGQVGDTGTIRGDGLELRVLDTFKILEMHVHRCSLITGLLVKSAVGHVVATVDAAARQGTVRNHSATHLLHSALRQVLGPHVQQQGSRVAPEGLRFDFTHPKGLTARELESVETLVNREIFANAPVEVKSQSLDEAKSAGAIALFGEKYGDRVRAVRMGEFSHELCGGTHAGATGQIGLFRLISESSIAAGIRRIEAVTGFGALDLMRQQSTVLGELAANLKVVPAELSKKVQELGDKLRDADRELKAYRQEQVNLRAGQLIERSTKAADGTRIVIEALDPAQFPKDTHQTLLDTLAARLGSGVAVLTQVEGEGLTILAAVGQDSRTRFKAGDLVKELSALAEGRGGGRPDKAQAGSKRPDLEPKVRQRAKEILLGGPR